MELLKFWPFNYHTDLAGRVVMGTYSEVLWAGRDRASAAAD